MKRNKSRNGPQHCLEDVVNLRRRVGRGDMPARIHPIDIHVGHRLRERRLRLALWLETLGRTVGVRAQQIQKYENGRDRISSSRLYLLANALRVPVGFFFKALPKHSCALVRVRANRSRDSAT